MNIDISELNFFQLREMLLNSDLYDKNLLNNVMIEFHDKLSNITDLVPLLKSDDLYGQFSALYICTLEPSNKVKEVFDYIYPLIKSSDFDVRYNACCCFIDNTGDPLQCYEFLNLLSDKNLSIRGAAINTLSTFEPQLIVKMSQHAKSINTKNTDLDLLIKSKSMHIRTSELIENINSKNKIVRVCAYLIATEQQMNPEEMKKFLSTCHDKDILENYEIYYK